MAATRVFVSFDFDNDQALKNLLIGQARNKEAPFVLADWSLKEAAPLRDWEARALTRIKRADVLLVLVGAQTHRASGVLEEVRMAGEESVRRVQVQVEGSDNKWVPDAGRRYYWTWENLKTILA